MAHTLICWWRELTTKKRETMEKAPQVWRSFFESQILTLMNSHSWPLAIILVELQMNVGISWVPRSLVSCSPWCRKMSDTTEAT